MFSVALIGILFDKPFGLFVSKITEKDDGQNAQILPIVVQF